MSKVVRTILGTVALLLVVLSATTNRPSGQGIAPCDDCAKQQPCFTCYWLAKCCTNRSDMPEGNKCSWLKENGWSIIKRGIEPAQCFVSSAADGNNQECYGRTCGSEEDPCADGGCTEGFAPCDELPPLEDGTRDQDQCGCCSTGDSPILLDVGGDGYRMSGAQDGVLFDFNGRGIIRWVGWPVANDDGWLALDRSGNGLIDNGSELFGNAVRLRTGKVARHGYEALAEFDENADHLIDQRDTVFSQLRVWLDTNRDGRSAIDELPTLVELGIEALSTEFRQSARTDRWGNDYRLRAKMYMTGGAQRFSYDVFWDSEPATGLTEASLTSCRQRPNIPVRTVDVP